MQLYNCFDFAKILYIVSPYYEEIAKQIGIKVRRGSTSLYGKGMYGKEEKQVLLCAVSRGEVRQIMQIIKSIDKKAFVVITNAREVFGKGFKEN